MCNKFLLSCHVFRWFNKTHALNNTDNLFFTNVSHQAFHYSCKFYSDLYEQMPFIASIRISNYVQPFTVMLPFGDYWYGKNNNIADQRRFDKKDTCLSSLLN